MSYERFYPDSSSQELPWEMLIEAGANPGDVHFVRHWRSEHGEETDHCKLIITDLSSCNHSDKKIYVLTMDRREWIKALDLPRLAERLKRMVELEKNTIRGFPESNTAYMFQLSAPPPPPPPTFSDKLRSAFGKTILGLAIGGVVVYYSIICLLLIGALILFCSVIGYR